MLSPTGRVGERRRAGAAGDHGYTIVKALNMVRDKTLLLARWTLVVVDEAGMATRSMLYVAMKVPCFHQRSPLVLQA